MKKSLRTDRKTGPVEKGFIRTILGAEEGQISKEIGTKGIHWNITAVVST